MRDRARLEVREYDPPASHRWCLFPCQNPATLHLPSEERMVCRVPIKPHVLPNGAGWTWDESTPPEAPTLSPSINCQSDTCWHGYIVNGEVVNPKTESNQ